MRARVAAAAALFVLAIPCHAAPPCAVTLRELRALLGDTDFPLQWRETTMDDGKPLTLSVFEREGLLFLSFVKAEEGLWAEAASTVCMKGAELEARFAPEKTRVGPAAHWAMRYSLSNGAQFTFTRMGIGRIRIATMGWSGMFSARESE